MLLKHFSPVPNKNLTHVAAMLAERGQQLNTGTQESDMAIHDHTPASRQLKNIIIP